MKFRLFMAAGAIFLAVHSSSRACDVCATHIAMTGEEVTDRPVFTVYEQYSEFDGRDEGEQVDFESYITQALLGWRFNPRWAVQLGVPYLDRSLDEEEESGVGDATLVGRYRLVDRRREENVFRVDLYGGVKMPTGDSDRLEEESESHPDAPEAEREENHRRGHTLFRHEGHDHESGEEEEHAHGGHHLALGSGSWDGIFGAIGLVKRGRFLAAAEAQYNLRTEGDHGFEYGDEFIWMARALYYTALEHAWSLALGPELSGHGQEENELDGEATDDESESAVYLGPAMQLTVGERMSGSLAADFPVAGEDEGLHGAADYRVRGSLTWIF